MKSKKKLLISMLVVSFSLISVIATVAIVFALTQQRILTTLNITYVAEDIDGTASGSFTIGGVTEKLTAMKGNNVIGDKLVFKASDTEDAGNLMFPEDALALTSQNDNIIIQYTYSNTGSKHYIASMDFAANIDSDNMKVEYSINGTEYSEKRYAVVVPAYSSNKSYWIKISIIDKAKSASFKGDFDWLLKGCDEQSDDYLTLPSLDIQATGTAGEYSVKVTSVGQYAGNLVIPSSVGDDPVTKIVSSTLTQAEKDLVRSVYIPTSVETIGRNTFESFTNLETITFEQNEVVGASVQSNSGLKKIESYAFKKCKNIKEFALPTTVTSVDYSCFDEAEIGTFVFLSDLIVERYYYYPSYLKSLDYIKVSDNVQNYYIDGYCLIRKSDKVVLLGCNNSVIPMDGSINSIIGGVFGDHCSKLTDLVIPAGVVLYGEAISYPPNLKNLTINGDILTDGDEDCIHLGSNPNVKLTLAEGCTSLMFNLVEGYDFDTIVIPSSLTMILKYAGRYLTAKKVVVKGNLNWTLWYDTDDGQTIEEQIEFSSSDYEYNAQIFNRLTELEHYSWFER